jgi:hypothetical protein
LIGRYALAEDQILAAELLARDIAQISNSLISNYSRIVDPGRGKFGLVILGSSLLISVREKH